MATRAMAVVAAFLLGGCASFGGTSLVPGQSTAKDVEELMGAPTERAVVADGDTVWYYRRQPYGMQNIGVRLTPAGVVRSVQQLLTEENLKNIVAGTTTAAQARQVLGPPFLVSRLSRQERDVWEYRMFNAVQQEYFLFVQMSYDGVVREVLLIKDYSKEQGAGTQP